MELKQILSHVDHTLLSPTAGWEEIRAIVDDGIRYRTASVCIPPSFVSRAAAYSAGRVPVCTVSGFPNGYSTRAAKCFEAADAVHGGADEIDMVVDLGLVKDGRFDAVQDEISAVKAACEGKLLKVIIETCYLTQEEKIRMCGVVTAAGADFIKTSTGFGPAGATRGDVALMVRHVGPGVRVKAAGGISSLQDACDFLDLGASRLGTSRIVRIVKEQEHAGA